MPLTTAYRQGDIVLVPFPFTDLTTTKKRPALIISPDSFNQFNQDLVLAAITSQPIEEQYSVLLHKSDLRVGKLLKTSVVRATKIFTIHSMLIVKRIGALNQAKLDEVLIQIRQFFSQPS